MHHRIVIIGGGTAGLSVAARLRRLGMRDVALVEPAGTHYYQPLFTLVGAGVVPLSRSARNEVDLVPQGVAWIRDAVAAIDPSERLVQTESGARIHYDVLVLCPGVELAWDLVPGLSRAMASPAASSNYAPGLADKTRRLIERFEGGSALFCAPGTPIKCPGTPQKAAYLASDSWRRRGILSKCAVSYMTGVGGIFGVPEFARVLEGVVQRYGIETHFSTELIKVDPEGHTVTLEHRGPGGNAQEVVAYDLLHVAPPPSVLRALCARARCRTARRSAGSPSTGTACATSATPRSSPSATSAMRRRPRPVPPSAVKRPWSPRTSGRCSPARRWQRAMTAMRRARSPPRMGDSCSPSSTTACARTLRSL